MKETKVLILLVWMMKILMIIQLKYSIWMINIPINVLVVVVKNLRVIFIILINNGLIFVVIVDHRIIQIIDHYQVEILPIDNHLPKNNFFKQSKSNSFFGINEKTGFCFSSVVNLLFQQVQWIIPFISLILI